MGGSTSDDNMQGTMTAEGIVEGDIAVGKMGTNTSKGNMHGMGHRQTDYFLWEQKFNILPVKSFMQ